ncbi:hypothetical protein NPIL_398031 [Nephila pilipes]|uniref:Uncharacterized protein n=1 Tax=Nephila pilipes TaxID=299642 RepID=A0A8X6UUA3_NEPPI|nr:hypothetical protein NPIL_398031 [Nephila pilipes]
MVPGGVSNQGTILNRLKKKEVCKGISQEGRASIFEGFKGGGTAPITKMIGSHSTNDHWFTSSDQIHTHCTSRFAGRKVLL